MAKSPENLPNRIRYFRERAGASQIEIAAKINVSKVTISALETGRMQLTLDYMRRLARIFGVTPVDLLNEDEQNDFLRTQEMELIRAYRMADPLQREMIHRVAEPREKYDYSQSPAADGGSEPKGPQAPLRAA